jgi:AcrR family transcriptional regulator
MTADQAPRAPGWRRERPEPSQEPLTLDRIVATAIDLVDREGLDALSMRRLGTELGAGATTVYWHVKNKDELLDLMLDQVFVEIETPDPDRSWRDQLASMAHNLRRVLLRHRNLIMVVASRPTTGPNAIAAIDLLFGVVRRSGLPDERVVAAAISVLNYASGFAVLEAASLAAFDGADEAAIRQAVKESADQVMAFIMTLPPERYPNVQLLGRHLVDGDDDSRFAYGLEVMLDGLEADVARSGVSA